MKTIRLITGVTIGPLVFGACFFKSYVDTEIDSHPKESPTRGAGAAKRILHSEFGGVAK